MRHRRAEVIRRTIREFERLDRLVAGLTGAVWALPVPRSEAQAPWTIKDVVAHITHWKADVARKARGEPPPPEERELNVGDGNRLVYERWRDRPPRDVLAWHRQVQADVLAALRAAPEKWFSGRERRPEWPYDLDGHLADHRVKDIERALAAAVKSASPGAPRRARRR
jgi:hypothetical protein